MRGEGRRGERGGKNRKGVQKSKNKIESGEALFFMIKITAR